MGGNLTDLFRAKKYLEIIEEENLVSNVQFMDSCLLKESNKFQSELPNIFSNARDSDLICAIALNDKATRDAFRKNFSKMV